MTPTIKSIPEHLVDTRGNIAEVARRLSCDRRTVKRYARDNECKHHAIVNGVLMVHQGGRGRSCIQ